MTKPCRGAYRLGRPGRREGFQLLLHWWLTAKSINLTVDSEDNARRDLAMSVLCASPLLSLLPSVMHVIARTEQLAPLVWLWPKLRRG